MTKNEEYKQTIRDVLENYFEQVKEELKTPEEDLRSLSQELVKVVDEIYAEATNNEEIREALEGG